MFSDHAPLAMHGRVVALSGAAVTIDGLGPWAGLGTRALLEAHSTSTLCEVVGFRNGLATALAFGGLDGVGPGAPATLAGRHRLRISPEWLGRVLDPLGNSMDGGAPPTPGATPLSAENGAPSAGTRARLGPTLSLGVRALDLFATCRIGQRLGLFAASGVGKSSLLSMMVRGASCDVAVLALVGERGRELQEFITDDLGPEGMSRSIVICATSDMTPMLRREAALTAMAVAEHFADMGKHVLLLMDSVTRYAMALREIGLAAGEPPTTKGYPPSVFAELPKLLERAGPRRIGTTGAITGLFTVLVEGDDHDEPIADAVRGILDGHVVLDRQIGEKGRYPAVDVLRSLSRTVPGCLTKEQQFLAARARRVLSLQSEVADLVRLGAYRPGTDTTVDEALLIAPRIEAMLAQGKSERSTIDQAFTALRHALEATDAT